MAKIRYIHNSSLPPLTLRGGELTPPQSSPLKSGRRKEKTRLSADFISNL